MTENNLKIYLTSDIIIPWAVYNEFAPWYFKATDIDLREEVWKCLPYVLEQIVLSDEIYQHPDFGTYFCDDRVLMDSVESWCPGIKPAKWQKENAKHADIYFISKFQLPYVSLNSFKIDLINATAIANKKIVRKRTSAINVTGFIEKEYDSINKEVYDALGGEYKKINYPLLFAYIVSKAEKYEDLFDIAFDLREAKQTIEYRKFCVEIDSNLKAGHVVEASKALNEISNILQKLSGKLKSDNSIQISIGFPPSISLSFPFFNKSKRHLVFIRDLISNAKLYGLGEKLDFLHRQIEE